MTLGHGQVYYGTLGMGVEFVESKPEDWIEMIF